MLKNRELDNLKIDDLIKIISLSPTIKNKLIYKIWSNKQQEILRKYLLDICYKVCEMEVNNFEISEERLKNFDEGKHFKNDKNYKSLKNLDYDLGSPKITKDKKLKVIEIKAKDKEDALSQLKDILPKDIYNRIKKEMI